MKFIYFTEKDNPDNSWNNHHHHRGSINFCIRLIFYYHLRHALISIKKWLTLCLIKVFLIISLIIKLLVFSTADLFKLT